MFALPITIFPKRTAFFKLLLWSSLAVNFRSSKAMQKHSLWHTSISVSAGEKHQDAVYSRNKSFLTGTTPPTSWKQHFITCSCPWWDFDSYQSINVSKMGPSLLNNIERNGQKISDYWGMAKVFGRSVLLVFCFHNYFFTAVLNCTQDFCSVVSRGKTEGMHTEGTKNKLLTCKFFDYCMLPSVFLNHPVFLQFVALFQLQPPLLSYLPFCCSQFDSLSLFLFSPSPVLTCSLFPCHYLAFVISPASFQQILQDSSQLLTPVKWQVFAPLVKRQWLFSMPKLSQKSGVGRSDLPCSLARHVLLVISAPFSGVSPLSVSSPL